jgi:hypothetical protein
LDTKPCGKCDNCLRLAKLKNKGQENFLQKEYL